MITNFGTSPAITISAEDIDNVEFHSTPDIDIAGISPPDLAAGNSLSEGVGKWQQPYVHWIGKKVTEPKYDGIGKDLAQISNAPDFIQDHHMISIMRNIDMYLEPDIRSHIFVEAHGPRPTPPNTGAIT